MTLEELEDALDSFGGDLSNWPTELRRAAEALTGRSAEARALLREAQELEAALGPEALPEAPSSREAELTERIMQRVAEHETRQQNIMAGDSARGVSVAWLKRLLRPGSWQIPQEAVAICCGTVVGMLVGMVLTAYWPVVDATPDFVRLSIASYF